MIRPELTERPLWTCTDNAYFPSAAWVHGQWWVLRLNGFPDHPNWTLFVDGQVRCDVEDAPCAWGRPAAADRPAMNDEDIAAALGPVESFVAYGSEAGRA